MNAGPSGGSISRVPLIGPIATYTPASFLSLTAWTGVSAGNTATGEFDLGNLEISFLQLDSRINLADNLYAGFTYPEFSGKNYLPYVGVSLPVRSTMALFGSVTLPVVEKKFADPMFFLGFRLGFNYIFSNQSTEVFSTAVFFRK